MGEGKYRQVKRVLFALFLSALAAAFPTGAAFAEPVSGIESITADELHEWMNDKRDFLLLDARNKDAYDTAHIRGAVLPFPEEFWTREALYKSGLSPAPPDRDAYLEEGMRPYAKDRLIVAYCNRDCRASAALLEKLQKLGYGNLRDMSEGFQAWEEKGYPIAISVPHLRDDVTYGSAS